jgi:FKBP-type peptidyl-prolyl cis-trans isomerase 2
MQRNPVQLSLFLLLSTSLFGCAAPAIVGQGDRAAVQFTCRLSDGSLAASTSKNSGKGDGQKRSVLFLERGSSDPVTIVAGTPGELPSDNLRSFEDEILEQLRGRIVGMKEGERRALELAPRMNRAVPAGANRVPMARVRVRPKELRLSTADFRARTGKKPEVGGSYTLDPSFPGQVAAVGEAEVLVRFTATPGQVVPLNFGTGVVADAGDHYEIRVETEKGRLVRSGGLVGRVAQVDDRLIHIDYPDPFAGETLSCDVTLESVQKGAALEPAAQHAAEDDRVDIEIRVRGEAGSEHIPDAGSEHAAPQEAH